MTEAIHLCRKQLATWPADSLHEAWHNLAYVQNSSGDKLDALESIGKAIALAPKHPGHRDARACWALEQRHFDLVIGDCTALLEIEGERESIAFVDSALAMRAYALIQVGNPASALADLRRVAGDGPFRILRRDWSKQQLIDLAGNRTDK